MSRLFPTLLLTPSICTQGLSFIYVPSFIGVLQRFSITLPFVVGLVRDTFEKERTKFLRQKPRHSEF